MPTYVLEAAALALRSARYAYGSPMQNKPVAKIVAFLRRYDLPQRSLYLCRIFDIIHQSNEIAEPYTVGVRDDSRLSEHISHHKVCALPTHARQ